MPNRVVTPVTLGISSRSVPVRGDNSKTQLSSGWKCLLSSFLALMQGLSSWHLRAMCRHPLWAGRTVFWFHQLGNENGCFSCHLSMSLFLNSLSSWASSHGRGMLDEDFREHFDDLLIQRARPSPSVLPLFILPWPTTAFGPSAFHIRLDVESDDSANVHSQTRHCLTRVLQSKSEPAEYSTVMKYRYQHKTDLKRMSDVTRKVLH